MEGKRKQRTIKNFFQILKRVFFLLWKSSKKYLILTVLINVFTGILITVVIVVWKYLIDSVGSALAGESIKPVIVFLTVYFFINYIERVLDRNSEYCRTLLSSYLNKYTTDIILEKAGKTDMRYFDDSTIYDKIQKVNMESTGRSIGIMSTVINFIQSLSSLIGTAIVLATLSSSIMIACIVICIPALVVSIRIANKHYEIYNERFENLRFVNYLKGIATSYDNIKEMKIYSVNQFFKEYILNTCINYIDEDKKIQKKFCRKLYGTDFLEEFSIFIFKVYIVIRIIKEKFTLGDLSLYIGAIDNFRNSSTVILNTISSIYENGLYIQNFFDFLDMDTQEGNAGELFFDKQFKKIEIKHVWFRYPNEKKYVLKDINLCIESGKCYALVGLNGSGKTTLIKLLLKLYTPDKGGIYIDGVNIKDINTETYYDSIGVVFQDYVKYPFTVARNIGIGDVNHIDDIEKIRNAAEYGGADDFIKNLPDGYETKLQKEWSESAELSMGQWQKLAISRAFMKDSSIVILDEPTASLDAKAEYEIYLKFRKLMAGKTCILIAHRFSTVKQADKILVIKNEKIIEQGSHKELMNINGEYAELYNIQAEAYNNE